MDADGATVAGDRLFERRVVLVSGELDGAAVSDVAARLMTLDALGDERIELRVGTCRGTLEDALALLDVLDVLGVEVDTLGFGTLDGGPVGVFAAGSHRRIAAHARLCLREPEVSASGTARDLERSLAEHSARRAQFLSHLARRTQRPVAELEEEWARRQVLEAVDAVALRYADEVAQVTDGRARPAGAASA